MFGAAVITLADLGWGKWALTREIETRVCGGAVLMIALFQLGNYSRDKRKDPVPQRASQVVWQASRRIKHFGEVNASPKTFLRWAEKHKLMNSLPLSQVFMCNEIVAVILINDLSYELSGDLGVPRAVSKAKQTRDGTDFTWKNAWYVVFLKRNKWGMFAAENVLRLCRCWMAVNPLLTQLPYLDVNWLQFS